MLATFASKDDFKKLEELIKKLRQQVDQHTYDIENLNDLFNSLKNMTSAPPSKDINGVTANDILLLRSRIEYLESQNTSVKKICTELRK